MVETHWLLLHDSINVQLMDCIKGSSMSSSCPCHLSGLNSRLTFPNKPATSQLCSYCILLPMKYRNTVFSCLLRHEVQPFTRKVRSASVHQSCTKCNKLLTLEAVSWSGLVAFQQLMISVTYSQSNEIEGSQYTMYVCQVYKALLPRTLLTC